MAMFKTTGMRQKKPKTTGEIYKEEPVFYPKLLDVNCPSSQMPGKTGVKMRGVKYGTGKMRKKMYGGSY